jgi:uncharacterized protein (DUF302 family)
MKSFFIVLVFFFTYIHASYEIIDKENIYTIKIKDESFEDLLINLRDEINHQGYLLVHELNLAKSTAVVAKALDKKSVLKNGINILICKSSLTLKMHEENIENITYCPLNISVYEYKEFKYISYKKYRSFKKNDNIAEQINERLENLIIESLD